MRTRCCCPMEFYGLKLAETQATLKAILLFSDSLGSFSCEGDLRAYSRSLLGQANRRVSYAGLVRAVEIVIAFSPDSLLKRHAYGAKRIGAFHGHPGDLDRARR